MEIVSTSQAPQPKVPLSQAVKSGNLVFVSGITPFTLTLELAVGDFDKQMKQTMENVGAILRAAGTDFDRVLKTTVILARRDDWRRMNEIYSALFSRRQVPGSYRIRRTAASSGLPR